MTATILNGAFIHKHSCSDGELFEVLVYYNDFTNRIRCFRTAEKAQRYARFVNKICWAKLFGYPSINHLKTVAGIDYDKRKVKIT